MPTKTRESIKLAIVSRLWQWLKVSSNRTALMFVGSVIVAAAAFFRPTWSSLTNPPPIEVKTDKGVQRNAPTQSPKDLRASSGTNSESMQDIQCDRVGAPVTSIAIDGGVQAKNGGAVNIVNQSSGASNSGCSFTPK